jgi:putative alpha-1,2-mannosidase
VAGAAALVGVGTGAATPTAAFAVTMDSAVATQAGPNDLGVPLGATSGGPASAVDPIEGTGVGSSNPGNISEYPGASVPLGMVQFSPDTSPHRGVTTGSGYDYGDSHISGFSLTHLSGDGCAIYGDVPVLPITGAVPADPGAARQHFSHTHERASAGNRSQNWQNLFDPSTGYLTSRTADGSFPPGPAFQPASAYAQSQGIAQEGFEEGNAIQYTWAVPQNLGGLFGLMGGDAAAVAKLNTFFTQLNATRFKPYDWAGNEPSMSAPYAYNYAGAPWGTQSVVRRIMTKLYSASAVNEPGEDDLGALSSWYVWSAIGLYPETPGVADLAMTSPLFPKVTVAAGGGHTLMVLGAHAPDPFIQGADLAIGSTRSRSWDKPWVPARALKEGGTLSVQLGPTPRKTWGSAASDAPPSFSAGAAPAVPFSTPGGALTMPAHSSATFQLGARETSVTKSPETVSWQLASQPGSSGVTVSSTSGTMNVTGLDAETTLQVTSQGPGDFPITFDLSQGGVSLPDLTLDVAVTS